MTDTLLRTSETTYASEPTLDSHAALGSARARAGLCPHCGETSRGPDVWAGYCGPECSQEFRRVTLSLSIPSEWTPLDTVAGPLLPPRSRNSRSLCFATAGGAARWEVYVDFGYKSDGARVVIRAVWYGHGDSEASPISYGRKCPEVTVALARGAAGLRAGLKRLLTEENQALWANSLATATRWANANSDAESSRSAFVRAGFEATEGPRAYTIRAPRIVGVPEFGQAGGYSLTIDNVTVEEASAILAILGGEK